MLDYQEAFDAFCKEAGLPLTLSLSMPEGYAAACGTFDPETDTVYLNAEALGDAPDPEKAFYLFHELRHAQQYLFPDRFSPLIRTGLQYVIQYDGTCYKRTPGGWLVCRLEGPEEYFTKLYLAQPHERDANSFAEEQVRRLYGDSPELREVSAFWTPEEAVPEEVFRQTYALIEEKAKSE